MERELQPVWTREEREKGARLHKMWEDFFSEQEKSRQPSELPRAEIEEAGKVAKVRERHEAELLAYPNVVGVAEGIRTRRGKPTGERCIVVYVERKVPRKKLSKREVLPAEIEGVPVDVIEAGKIEAL